VVGLLGTSDQLVAKASIDASCNQTAKIYTLDRAATGTSIK